MATSSNQQLHMVQMWLDTRRLMELGRMLHLPLKQVGNNYLVHCALGEMFQDQAPQPFCVEDSHQSISNYQSNNGHYIRVLSYSQLDGKTLHELAKGFATPTVYAINDWNRLASKPMPDVFPEGLQVGFELRACPVIRKSSDGPKWKEGQEVDAFLSRVWEIDDKSVEVDREETYVNWLNRLLDLKGGAEPVEMSMKRFSLERMTRRNHKSKRKVTTIKRPDVTLNGKLRVTNGSKFKQLLQNGIGRHKSFGFGMLKIRRA